VIINPSANGITIGVLSDTHIPDRTRKLNPEVLTVFKGANVGAILHAGDVSILAVLRQLADIAPVTAVRGNRDWIALPHLPRSILISVGSVQIGLTHGHGLPWNYMVDRVKYMIGGYRLEMFQPRLISAFPQAQVIVFGHTHRALNKWVDGKLLFNPGSPHFPDRKDFPPSVGLIHISSNGDVVGEIRALSDKL
jgi:putative phosphoesterase